MAQTCALHCDALAWGSVRSHNHNYVFFVLRSTMVLSSDDVHGLVLISDTMDATGSAVMGHLTKLAISSDPKLDVVIVSSHYASSSYAASLRRAGLQASSLFSSGRIKVIEVPRLARERKGHAINLKSLSRLIYEVLSASKAVGRSACVVFDDLTASFYYLIVVLIVVFNCLCIILC